MVGSRLLDSTWHLQSRLHAHREQLGQHGLRLLEKAVVRCLNDPEVESRVQTTQLVVVQWLPVQRSLETLVGMLNRCQGSLVPALRSPACGRNLKDLAHREQFTQIVIQFGHRRTKPLARSGLCYEHSAAVLNNQTTFGLESPNCLPH